MGQELDGILGLSLDKEGIGTGVGWNSRIETRYGGKWDRSWMGYQDRVSIQRESGQELDGIAGLSLDTEGIGTGVGWNIRIESRYRGNRDRSWME